MRIRMFAPVVAVLASMLPLAAGASTTSGDLTISPAHGLPGSHFMATFSFTEAPCNAYVVYFYWDPPNPALELGSAHPTGTGPTCQVSMDLVVPSTDSAPNHSYPVLADAQTQQVNAGSASAVNSSSKDSGMSQFEVTGPAPSGSTGSTNSSGPTHGATGSTAVPTGTGAGITGPSSGGDGASGSSGAPVTSPSPEAAGGSAPGSGSSKAPPPGTEAPHTPGASGNGGAILGAAAVVALLVAAAWTYRTGRLRTLLRR